MENIDKKCKNCGQFLDDKDKFCRYCGCPSHIITSQPLPKLSARKLDDQLQEIKTLVKEEDISRAVELDYSLVTIKRKGEMFSLRLRSVIFMILAFAIAAGGTVLAFFVKGLEGNSMVVAFGVILCVFTIFIALTFAIERGAMITTFGQIKEKAVTVPKFGLKKTPMFMLGGYIFSMELKLTCPICSEENGEGVKGDLHLEKIDERIVAVCNYNRKHLYYISANAFFEYYLGKTRQVIDASAKSETSDSSATKSEKVIESAEQNISAGNGESK